MKKIKRVKYLLVFMVVFVSLLMTHFIFTRENNKISKANNETQTDDLKYLVSHPDLHGNSFKQGPFFIKSKEMVEKNEVISFDYPIIKIMLKHNDWLNATCELAELISENELLTLYSKVKANINEEYYLETEKALIDSKDLIISSDVKSILFNNTMHLTSDNGFMAYMKDSLAKFYGKINLNIIEEDKSNVIVKSSKLDFDWNKKIADFRDQVLITKDDTQIYSDKMLAFFNLKTNKLEKLKFFGNVKIINPKQQASSNYGEYLVETSIITLMENVRLIKDGNTITGEKLNYHVKNKTATMLSSANDKQESKPKERSRAIIIPQ